MAYSGQRLEGIEEDFIGSHGLYRTVVLQEKNTTTRPHYHLLPSEYRGHVFSASRIVSITTLKHPTRNQKSDVSGGARKELT